MIKFENVDVWGFEHAIRGMRNPLNSWGRSDSYHTGNCSHNGCKECSMNTACTDGDFWVGKNDKDLMTRLIRAGAPHRKFLRQIFVSVDITAPLYWWSEFDTYKVGTTANSCSKMHTLHKRDLTINDFSHEHLDGADTVILNDVIAYLNYNRNEYVVLKDKNYWWTMIQLLPNSFNQKRTVTMTYENLLNMLEYRRGHKLDEWRAFCEWIDTLPYGSLLHEGLTDE